MSTNTAGLNDANYRQYYSMDNGNIAPAASVNVLSNQMEGILEVVEYKQPKSTPLPTSFEHPIYKKPVCVTLRERSAELPQQNEGQEKCCSWSCWGCLTSCLTSKKCWYPTLVILPTLLSWGIGEILNDNIQDCHVMYKGEPMDCLGFSLGLGSLSSLGVGVLIGLVECCRAEARGDLGGHGSPGYGWL